MQISLVLWRTTSLLALTIIKADAFLNIHQPIGWQTPLEAKKGKSKSKKSTAASGAGFGTEKAKPKRNDSFATFPRLEPQVIETLDPAPEDWTSHADQLPQEIYDRLGQIHALKNFNYDTDDSPLSLSELMSAPESADNDSLLGKPATSSSALNLDDLLSTATGGAASTKVSASPPPTPVSQDLSLSSLPIFKDFRVLHIDPLVLAIDDFFTHDECDRYVSLSSGPDVMQSKSPTVGKDATAKAQRTSTTYYHHFKNVPELMAKASRLLGLDTIHRWEEPQTVRYRNSEKFTWHLDALGPNENKPELGGQRLATLLVYLTDLDEDEGGATMFRDLGSGRQEPLKVHPKKGSALLFFPAAGGVPNTPFDVRTLHCGEAVAKDARNEKWISQLWLRESVYTPTAPPDNSHAEAADAIAEYCTSSSN